MELDAHFDEIEHSVQVAMTQLALKSELAQCTPRPELDGRQVQTQSTPQLVLVLAMYSTTGATTGDRRFTAGAGAM